MTRSWVTVVALLAALSACTGIYQGARTTGPAPFSEAWPAAPRPYGEVHNDWTRRGRVVHDFDRLMDVTATFKSTEWRAAYVARRGAAERMPQSERDDLAKRELAESREHYELELLVRTYRNEDNDLQKNERSRWRVALVDESGGQIRPSEIRRDRRSRGDLLQLFPDLVPQHEVYIAKFPRSQALLDGRRFSRDDEASRVDAELRRLPRDPMHARDAIVEAGGKGSDFGGGGGQEAVSKIDHRDGDALVRDRATPGAVDAVEAGLGLHSAAVEVDDSRYEGVGLGPDQEQRDRVVVGRGRELVRLDHESIRRRDLLRIELVHRRFHRGCGGTRLRAVRLGEQRLSTLCVRSRLRRKRAHRGLESRVDARIRLHLRRHDVGPPLPVMSRTPRASRPASMSSKTSWIASIG